MLSGVLRVSRLVKRVCNVLRNLPRVFAAHLAAILFAVALTLGTSARARASETTVDLSVGPLIGTHAEAGARDAVGLVPIPIIALAHRESIFEVFVEGLPLSPAITSSSAAQSVSTHLTFENAMFRLYLLGDRLAVGAGEAIYNQESRFDPGSVINASRVVGGRYEVAIFPLIDGRLRIAVDLVPVLRGTLRARLDQFPSVQFTPADERGSQAEVNLSYRTRGALTQTEYGVRYINYVSHFTQSGQFADRNTGFRPYASFGIHFGRR